MVCIIPFDLSRLDGKDATEENMVVNRILKVAKVRLFYWGYQAQFAPSCTIK